MVNLLGRQVPAVKPVPDLNKHAEGQGSVSTRCRRQALAGRYTVNLALDNSALLSILHEVSGISAITAYKNARKKNEASRSNGNSNGISMGRQPDLIRPMAE
jgi:hypothetical protein